MKKRIFSFIFILILCLLSCFAMPLTAFAEDINYSDVLSDLKKDSSFSIDDYPQDDNSTELKLIQPAESTDKKLYVYVYQPSGQIKNLRASSINFSTTYDKEKNGFVDYNNYKLEYINSNGVFFKYKVAGFTVSDDSTRYYAITAIYRPFDEALGDKNPESGNIITEVHYDVSKRFCCYTENGQYTVKGVRIDTITITDMFTGFVRYPSGFKLYVNSCDSHFVAFNADHPIDNLLEAEVTYSFQSCSIGYGIGGGTTYGNDKTTVTVPLSHSDKVTYNGGGLFAGTYTWDRIETIDKFVSSVDFSKNVYSGAILDVKVASQITEDAQKALKNKTWVLRFKETDYTFIPGATGFSTSSSTLVGDVAILRLMFQYKEDVYNLGALSDKQTGSKDPINSTSYSVEFDEVFSLIFNLILLILVLIIGGPVIKVLFKIIVFPFKVLYRLIKGLFKKRRS